MKKFIFLILIILSYCCLDAQTSGREDAKKKPQETTLTLQAKGFRQFPTTTFLHDLIALNMRPTQLRGITHLDLRGNHVAMIPPYIRVLTGLRLLNISDNAFYERTTGSHPLEAVALLPSLEELYVGQPHFVLTIPDSWRNLAKLRLLDLSNSMLVIPEDNLRAITSLRKLILSGARFEELPNLRGLTALQMLTAERLLLCTQHTTRAELERRGRMAWDPCSNGVAQGLLEYLVLAKLEDKAHDTPIDYSRLGTPLRELTQLKEADAE